MMPVLLLASSCGGEPQAPVALPDNLEVSSLEQIESAIARRAGQPLLVNFWAMWCAPCVAELPDLVAVAADFRAAGGEVLGVAMDLTAPGYSLDGVKRALPDFLRAHDLDYPILLFRDGDPFAITEKFDLPGPIPVTLAIDRSGVIVGMHEGRARREDFDALVAKAMQD